MQKCCRQNATGKHAPERPATTIGEPLSINFKKEKTVRTFSPLQGNVHQKHTTTMREPFVYELKKSENCQNVFTIATTEVRTEFVSCGAWSSVF